MGDHWKRRKRGKRSKEEREGEDDQEGIGIIKRDKGTLDQRGHWKKKKRRSLRGRKRVFSRINHQGFLDSCSV